MPLLMRAAQGFPVLDPIGTTDRNSTRFTADATVPFRGGGHRRFARIILFLIPLLLIVT